MPSCFPRPAGSTLVLALLVAASALPSQAQVVIRERVEIVPEAVTAAQRGADSPRYRYRLSIQSALTSCGWSCFEGLDGSAAYIVTGMRPDSTSFSVAIPVASLLVEDTRYEQVGGCLYWGSDGPRSRGYITYRSNGDATGNVGEAIGPVSVTTTFADPSWNRASITSGSVTAASYEKYHSYPYCYTGTRTRVDAYLSRYEILPPSLTVSATSEPAASGTLRYGMSTGLVVAAEDDGRPVAVDGATPVDVGSTWPDRVRLERTDTGASTTPVAGTLVGVPYAAASSGALRLYTDLSISGRNAYAYVFVNPPRESFLRGGGSLFYLPAAHLEAATDADSVQSGSKARITGTAQDSDGEISLDPATALRAWAFFEGDAPDGVLINERTGETSTVAVALTLDDLRSGQLVFRAGPSSGGEPPALAARTANLTTTDSTASDTTAAFPPSIRNLSLESWEMDGLRDGPWRVPGPAPVAAARMAVVAAKGREVQIEVEAVGTDVSGAISLTVLPGMTLAIEADRDTLLVTEGTTLTFGGVDDPDVLVTLSANTTYGRLVRVVGADTTALTGALPYSEIGSSRVLFVADGAWPTDDASVEITGTAGDDAFESATLVVRAPKLKVELSVDPATYLPVKNDTLTVTVRLANLPDALRTQVDIGLTQSYEFTFLDGSIESRSVPLARDAMGRDSARVQLLSKTWWGVATFRASIRGATASDTLKADIQVPIDSDGDTIADAWERDLANGGTLALGGTAADGDWDEETSPGTSHNGDNWAKIQEYQGFLIGPDHVRLTSGVKEVFFDIRGASYGAAALVQLESQLGVITVEVEGTALLGPTHSLSFPAAGTNALQFVSPSTQLSGGTPRIVYVEDQPYRDPSTTGVIIQGGVYVATGTTTPPATFDLAYGVTRGTVAGGGGISRVYVGHIGNMWNNNDASEADNIQLRISVPVNRGRRDWDARFNGRDINGDGDNSDVFNPFDLLSSGRTNDAADGRVATVLETDMVLWNTIHEIGHALGMSPGNNHPTKDSGAMREGPGPARTGTFTAEDISQLKLK